MKPEEAIHRTAIDVLEAAKVWSDDQSIKNKVHLDCRVIEWKEYGYPPLADEAKAKLSEDTKDCYVCGGTPPASGIPCICNNTGRAYIGMVNLLKVHRELVEELDKKQKELDEAKARLVEIEAWALWREKLLCLTGKELYKAIQAGPSAPIRAVSDFVNVDGMLQAEEKIRQDEATLAAVDEAMKTCGDCSWIKECDTDERYVPEEGRTCNDAMRSIRRARKGERQANPNDCEKFITMAQVVAEGRLVSQVREECHGTGWYRCKECVHYEP